MYTDENKKFHEDTCCVKNGIFTFSGLISEPTVAEFHNTNEYAVTSGYNVNGPYSKQTFLEPGVIKVILTDGKFKDAIITGSHTQWESDQLMKLQQPINKEIDSLMAVVRNISKPKSETTDQLALEINKNEKLRSNAMMKKFNISVDFVNTHPDSYLSPNELIKFQYPLSYDRIKLLYNQLNPSIKNSRDGISVAQIIQRKENALVGKYASDFKSIDVNGNPVSLSSFRDKSMVLLSFWNNMYRDCKEMNLHLKEVYNKYHSKGFDIISIAKDPKDVWLKALKQDSLLDLWHQIRIFNGLNTGLPTEDNLFIKYDMSFQPVLLLVNKEGKIVGRWDTQRTKEKEIELELDRKLAELIKLD